MKNVKNLGGFIFFILLFSCMSKNDGQLNESTSKQSNLSIHRTSAQSSADTSLNNLELFAVPSSQSINTHDQAKLTSENSRTVNSPTEYGALVATLRIDSEPARFKLELISRMWSSTSNMIDGDFIFNVTFIFSKTEQSQLELPGLGYVKLVGMRTLSGPITFTNEVLEYTDGAFNEIIKGNRKPKTYPKLKGGICALLSTAHSLIDQLKCPLQCWPGPYDCYTNSDGVQTCTMNLDFLTSLVDLVEPPPLPGTGMSFNETRQIYTKYNCGGCKIIETMWEKVTTDNCAAIADAISQGQDCELAMTRHRLEITGATSEDGGSCFLSTLNITNQGGPGHVNPPPPGTPETDIWQIGPGPSIECISGEACDFLNSLPQTDPPYVGCFKKVCPSPSPTPSCPSPTPTPTLTPTPTPTLTPTPTPTPTPPYSPPPSYPPYSPPPSYPSYSPPPSYPPTPSPTSSSTGSSTPKPSSSSSSSPTGSPTPKPSSSSSTTPQPSPSHN